MMASFAEETERKHCRSEATASATTDGIPKETESKRRRSESAAPVSTGGISKVTEKKRRHSEFAASASTDDVAMETEQKRRRCVEDRDASLVAALTSRHARCGAWFNDVLRACHAAEALRGLLDDAGALGDGVVVLRDILAHLARSFEGRCRPRRRSEAAAECLLAVAGVDNRLLALLRSLDRPAPPHDALLERAVAARHLDAVATALRGFLQSCAESLLLVGPSFKNMFEPLATSWRLPSDHLPVGAVWDGVCVASWNVLNTRYMAHICSDSQPAR